MSQPIFYEGQVVGCLMYGEGKVNRILENDRIIVKNADGLMAYKANGSIDTTIESRPTLYPIDQYREIIADLPAPQPEPWKPKPGEWCWFWDNNDNSATVAKFIRIYKKKYIAKVGYFEISFPNCAPFVGELPPHLKEVQP